MAGSIRVGSKYGALGAGPRLPIRLEGRGPTGERFRKTVCFSGRRFFALRRPAAFDLEDHPPAPLGFNSSDFLNRSSRDQDDYFPKTSGRRNKKTQQPLSC